MQRVIKTSRYEATLNPSGKTMFIVILNTDVNTDAVLGLGPTPDERLPTRDEDGLVNFFEDADDEADHQWREKLGKFLYDFVVKPDMCQQGIRAIARPDTLLLAHLPSNYSLVRHKKGDPHVPRIDYYLYGSRFVERFRSPMEFCLHLKWILDGQPKKRNGRPDCRCTYCDPSRTQGEISKELGTYRPHKRDGPGGGRGGKGGEGKGKPKQRTVISTTIPYKDYTKLNSATTS